MLLELLLCVCSLLFFFVLAVDAVGDGVLMSLFVRIVGVVVGPVAGCARCCYCLCLLLMLVALVC